MYGGGIVTSYPTATCAGTALTGGAANVDGAYVIIVAGSTITTRFRIVGICLDTPSGAMIGRVKVGVGATGSEVKVLDEKFEVATDAGGYLKIDTTGHGGIIPANSAVSALLATTAGGAQTINCSLLCEPC